MGHYQKKDAVEGRSGEELLVELRLSREELVQMINEGLRGMALEIGVEVATALLDDEVGRRCGAKGKRNRRRDAYRHGHQQGWIEMGGVKASIKRPRARLISGGEVEFDLYQRMQGGTRESVMRRLVRGVSCRNYREVLDAIRSGYGVSAASVSRSFVVASEARVRELAERRFEGMQIAAIFIDGVCFARETLVAAVGVTESGSKLILGVRQGATENARVCTDLLEDLRDRGIDTTVRTLFILDGSKALRSAVDRVWGDCAVVQRCQQHKLRNVASYVPDKYWPDICAAIRKAYAEPSYKKAKRLLDTIARWLDHINPSAAASLREGLDETLTITRLSLPGRLRSTFATTNVVESLFSRVRTITSRVTRWRPGSMRQRWCITALLHAEQSFRAVNGCSEMPKLLAALGRQSAKLSAVA
jgi:putative transposase